MCTNASVHLCSNIHIACSGTQPKAGVLKRLDARLHGCKYAIVHVCTNARSNTGCPL